MNDFSKNLKLLRTQRNIGQDELARYLHCSAGTVSNYENGRHEPDLETLCLIARFYGVSADYLLGLSCCPLPAERTSNTVYGKYTVGRFLRLLGYLSEKDRLFLAYGFRLLEKLRIPE